MTKKNCEITISKLILNLFPYEKKKYFSYILYSGDYGSFSYRLQQ